MTKVCKSFRNLGDPVTDYIAAHSAKPSVMLGAPEVVQLNQIFIRMLNGKKVLDVGVFTGMSSLAAALALPDDGKVLACDVSEQYTSIGEINKPKTFWKEAGVAHKIELHLRPGVETLQEAIDKGQEGTFDFAFIDADKINYTNYYELCLKLLRKGGVITVDNVLWSGEVCNSKIQDADTVAIRNLNDLIAVDERVHVTMQNIGDGLTICLKK